MERIPEISDERLTQLAEKIHPLVAFDVNIDLNLVLDKSGKPTHTGKPYSGLFRIKPVDLRGVSYIYGILNQLETLLCFIVLILSVHTTSGEPLPFLSHLWRKYWHRYQKAS